MASRGETERGRIIWHCSDPDSGPDVGLSLGLGNGAFLWVGEISKTAWSEGGSDVAALGADGGWWLLLYAPERIVLGKLVDAYYAQNFIEKLAELLNPPGASAWGMQGGLCDDR